MEVEHTDASVVFRTVGSTALASLLPQASLTLKAPSVDIRRMLFAISSILASTLAFESPAAFVAAELAKELLNMDHRCAMWMICLPTARLALEIRGDTGPLERALLARNQPEVQPQEVIAGRKLAELAGTGHTSAIVAAKGILLARAAGIVVVAVGVLPASASAPKVEAVDSVPCSMLRWATAVTVVVESVQDETKVPAHTVACTIVGLLAGLAAEGYLLLDTSFSYH